MLVPFLVLLGGTRHHPKQWAYISCGTCVRNRINLLRGNYKEPYIKQPEYEPAGLAESRTAEKERGRDRSEQKEEEISDIKEIGIERSKGIEEDGNACEGGERGSPSLFRFAGVPRSWIRQLKHTMFLFLVSPKNFLAGHRFR